MLTEQQRLAVEAAVRILKLGGIDAWFEARIIRDSDKKLNGRRVSSKRRTDLDRVLKVADAKRVGMLPDMRMELRMYATAASSRAVFMGVEQTSSGARRYGVDPGRPGGDHTAVAVVQDGKVVTIGGPELLEGRANYSPAKNVERLRAEGVADDSALMQQAKRRVPATATAVLGNTVSERGAPPPRMPKDREDMIVHTCDTRGPMRQREPCAPFVSTCSLCGEINDT